MHNRVGPKVTSFEVTRQEAIAIAPILLVVLVFAFYPQFGLGRSQKTVTSSLSATAAVHRATLSASVRPRRIYTYVAKAGR